MLLKEGSFSGNFSMWRSLEENRNEQVLIRVDDGEEFKTESVFFPEVMVLNSFATEDSSYSW